MKRLEQLFENAMWNSRRMVLLAVVSSLLLAFGAFCMATIDVIQVLGQVFSYLNLNLVGDARLTMREEIITVIVKAIDTYLIASILLIFGLGFYELFIKRIEKAHETDAAPSLLSVHSFDDLKDRMAKLILLVLITEYFQYAIKLKFTKALDLLYLALGILLIGGALYLSSYTKIKDDTTKGDTNDDSPDSREVAAQKLKGSA